MMKRNQKIKFEDGSLYKGSTKNGVPNGVGELVNGMNLKYKGKWKDGNKSGRGELEIELNGIFCIGGDDPKDEKEPFKLFYMIKKDGMRYDLSSCVYKRSVGRLIYKDQYLYYIGGFDGNKAVANVERYDFLANRWENMSSLINRRSSFGCFLYNSKIYVFGGVMGRVALNTMEEYDERENRWRIYTYLNYGRSSCLIHQWKGKCYIFGGLSCVKKLLPLEIFDMKTKKIEQCEDITTENYASGSILIEIDEKPYIIIAGGRTKNDNDIKKDVYIYSIEENKLNKIGSLNIERVYCSLIVFENNLYCMGGHDMRENAILNHEIYDFQTDTWDLCVNLLNVPTSGTSFLSIENKKIKLEGRWRDGVLNGKVMININEKNIEGRYKKGKKQGFFDNIYYEENIPVSYEELILEKKIEKIKNIPENFKCPISLEIMRDPVIIESGITFDRKNIEEWFLHHNTCPLTRNIVSVKCIPNNILKTMIQELIEKKICN